MTPKTMLACITAVLITIILAVTSVPIIEALQGNSSKQPMGVCVTMDFDAANRNPVVGVDSAVLQNGTVSCPSGTWVSVTPQKPPVGD